MKQTFSLQLGLAAPVEQLEAWFASAAPGAREIYATGVDLPREAAAVALVRRWQGEGLVTMFQKRDEADARKINWIVERLDAAGKRAAPDAPAEPRRDAITRSQLDELMGELRGCVIRRRACPSNRQLARMLDLGEGGKARRRVDYLVTLLANDGRIAVQSHGRNAPRTVTLLEGRGKGRSTRDPSKENTR